MVEVGTRILVSQEFSRVFDDHVEFIYLLLLLFWCRYSINITNIKQCINMTCTGAIKSVSFIHYTIHSTKRIVTYIVGLSQSH